MPSENHGASSQRALRIVFSPQGALLVGCHIAGHKEQVRRATRLINQIRSTRLRVISSMMDKFEWDGVKARGNLAKHGVSFEAALLVFDDPFAIERIDFSVEPVEVRYVITAMGKGVLLTVVYTERGDRIRIISARKATRHEQEEYYRRQAAD